MVANADKATAAEPHAAEGAAAKKFGHDMTLPDARIAEGADITDWAEIERSEPRELAHRARSMLRTPIHAASDGRPGASAAGE